MFIGIGSTIGEAPADASRKIVCGAGYVPYYHKAPNLQEGQWDVAFVRGPITAKRLNLAPELAIGDAGTLVRTQINTARKSGERISFMPHWESMEAGNWEEVCHEAGIHLIDPRKPVVKVIDELLSSKLLVTEAMHGAIVADAFRIPWVPVLPLNAVHREKWYDWAATLDLKLTPRRLWPSQLSELNFNMLRAKDGANAPFFTGEEHAAPSSTLRKAKRFVESSRIGTFANEKLLDMAAYRLNQLAKAPAMLSSERAIDRVTERMMEKVQGLRTAYAA